MHRVTSHKGAGRVGPAASTAHATETAEGWRKYQGAATGGKNGVKREEKRHMRQDNTNGVPGASRDRTRKKLFVTLDFRHLLCPRNSLTWLNARSTKQELGTVISVINLNSMSLLVIFNLVTLETN